MNCAVIDACFRIHNFIIDHHSNGDIYLIDRDIFDEDCRQFFAVNTEFSNGVFGGEVMSIVMEKIICFVVDVPNHQRQHAQKWGKYGEISTVMR